MISNSGRSAPATGSEPTTTAAEPSPKSAWSMRLSWWLSLVEHEAVDGGGGGRGGSSAPCIWTPLVVQKMRFDQSVCSRHGLTIV